MDDYYKICLLALIGMLVSVRGSPIMVSFGTRMAPITPPTPKPQIPVTYPLLPPAPVYEDPEPENNSVYKVPPLRYGYRLKPYFKSYQAPINYSKYYFYMGQEV